MLYKLLDNGGDYMLYLKDLIDLIDENETVTLWDQDTLTKIITCKSGQTALYKYDDYLITNIYETNNTLSINITLLEK